MSQLNQQLLMGGGDFCLSAKVGYAKPSFL